MSIFWVWSQFFCLASVIGFAGYHLLNAADVIAEETGLGRNWVGLIMLATVTSLPELMSGISSVRLADSPDLAAGDILGSCLFNLALVFLLDLIVREGSIYSKATQGHLFSGVLGIILIGFVGFGLTTNKQFLDLRIGHVGGFTAAIPVLYLLCMRILYSFEKDNRPKSMSKASVGKSVAKLKRAFMVFAMAAIMVISAGTALPFVGEKIMIVMGWNGAFVGSVFIALATSVPEIAVTISAVKLRAVELALSNLLGSNLFNIVILTIDDLFFTRGPLFQHISPAHSVTAFSAVMMTGLVLVALIRPPQKRILNTVSGMSILLLGVFFLNAYIIFKMGG